MPTLNPTGPDNHDLSAKSFRDRKMGTKTEVREGNVRRQASRAILQTIVQICYKKLAQDTWVRRRPANPIRKLQTTCAPQRLLWSSRSALGLISTMSKLATPGA